MEKIELQVTKRASRGKRNRALRLSGQVPGVVYGKGIKSEPVEVEGRLLQKVYSTAGGSKILSLKVGDSKPRNVLIHEVQQGPIKGELTHVDFYAVRMDEELKAEIPLHFVGESTAVYQDEGTLVKNVETVEVECLPADLPETIEVDISVLDDFDKTITLADLHVPSGVKLVETDLETLIAKVDPPRSDEEIAELEEAIDESAELPDDVKEEEPVVVSEENEGDKDRRDKK